MYWVQLEKGNGWKSRYEGLSGPAAKAIFDSFVETFGMINVTAGKMPETALGIWYDTR